MAMAVNSSMGSFPGCTTNPAGAVCSEGSSKLLGTGGVFGNVRVAVTVAGGGVIERGGEGGTWGTTGGVTGRGDATACIVGVEGGGRGVGFAGVTAVAVATGTLAGGGVGVTAKP